VRHGRGGTRALKLASVGLALCLLATGIATAAGLGAFDPLGQDEVGQTTANGSVVLAEGQLVKPAGTRLAEITDGRIISSAVSPNGTTLAAFTENRLLGGFLSIINLSTGALEEQVGLTAAGAAEAFGDGTVAADGPFYSPDGKTLWWPQSKDILRFSVRSDGTVEQTPSATIKLPATFSGGAQTTAPVSTPTGGTALPCGMAFSPDGTLMYVALNGNNTVGIIDTTTDMLVRQIPVGDAPRDVVYRYPYLYVSDEGGRPAGRDDVTNQTDYTPVDADPSTGAVDNGRVSVINLQLGRQVKLLKVGLEPAQMYQGPRSILVANTDDDSFSVIDTRTNTVSATVAVEPLAGVPVGGHVNSITAVDRHHILISLGRDNALAEFQYTAPGQAIKYLGLIPTDYDPVDVTASRGRIIVTNGQGIGARGFTGNPSVPTSRTAGDPYLTYDETGTVTELNGLPSAAALAQDTTQVFANNGWNHIAAVDSGSGDTVPNVIPPKLGMPSVIKHVFLIIRENRTYDQVLGDLGEGDGDAAYAQFGAQVTPNAHDLAERFGDLDNFYDAATLSADGHNWILQSDAPDYIESEFGTFARSYPASGGDALAYQRDGFIWNRALDKGLTVRNYGEYDNYFDTPAVGYPSWESWYEDSQILEGKESGSLPVPIDKFRSSTDVPSLERVTDSAFPEFDLNIPDQYRVDVWEQEFKQQVATDTFPNLSLMTIMSDHTGGGNGEPTVPAEVADNDLALGRIVDDISHSKEWASTAIFVDEDDSQNGVDHIDGHRTEMYVISPYSKPGVDSDYYDQPDMTRTIEQILGLKPMNQMDASAVPMYNAFQSTPNLAPYSAAQNIVPLTLGTPLDTLASGVSVSTLERRARTSVAGHDAWVNALGGATLANAERWQKLLDIPAAELPVKRAWEAWATHQHFGGDDPTPDFASPWLLNRFDWYESHAWRVPYPGDPKVYAPDQVPPPTAFLTARGIAATNAEMGFYQPTEAHSPAAARVEAIADARAR
jgi:YVTN family beta-propeller protein